MLRPKAFLLLPPTFLWFCFVFCVASLQGLVDLRVPEITWHADLQLPSPPPGSLTTNKKRY